MLTVTALLLGALLTPMLVATFDKSWLSRSGGDSLAAFPELVTLLDEAYAPTARGVYVFYRRRDARE